jgi:hypothetical protein
MGTNDITGDRITSKINKDTTKYSDNYDKIFNKLERQRVDEESVTTTPTNQNKEKKTNG